MKKATLLFLACFFSVTAGAQVFYRIAEAIKNPEKVETLVIFPDKDQMMPLATSARKFPNLHTVKITGTCDSIKMQSVNRAINGLPQLKTLIIERTDMEYYPSSPELNNTIERIELYENDMLDYSAFIEKAQHASVATLILDVFAINELPANLQLLKNLNSVKMYDRNTVLFDKHRGYDSQDADVKHFDYQLISPQKTISFAYYSAETIPSETDLEYIRKSINANQVLKEEVTEFEKEYKHILPPVKGLNAAKEVFVMNPMERKTVYSSTGTVIKIPGDAFVDKNGNPVTANVNIGYREFRNQTEILLSGIPMVIDSAGEKKQFESAGMFELTASANGEEVYLAKNKEITVEFTPENNAPDFNLYYYDDEAGNWEKRTEVETVTRENKGNSRKIRLTNALKLYMEMTTKSKAIRYDTTRFEFRFDNPAYSYLFARRCTTKKLEVENGKICDIKKLVKIVSAGNGKNGEKYFRVKNYFSVHPELSYLRDVTLVLNESQHSIFSKVEGKYFSDARVLQNGETFELTLKSGSEFHSITFYMVKLDADGNVITESKAPEIIWKKYSRKIKLRSKLYNRRIRLHTNYLDGFEVQTKEEIKLAAWEAARNIMTKKEKNMSKRQFCVYADSVFSNNVIAGLNDSKVATYFTRREIRMSKLGNYNLDKTVEIIDPVRVIVKMNFSDASEKKGIRLKTVYAVDKTSNTVYSYSPERPVVLDKSKNYMVLGFTEEGELVLPENKNIEAGKLKNNEHLALEAIISGKKPLLVEEMSALLGLQ